MKHKIQPFFIAFVLSLALLAAFPANAQAKRRGTRVISMKSIKGAKKRLPTLVTQAFQTLEFQIILNPSAGYEGMFSVRAHRIVLKKRNREAFLHEMGHFTAYLTDRPDLTADWRAIYRAERRSYMGYNRWYVRRDPSEYFAASFMDYCEHPGRLKKKRPQTWAYIKSVVRSITEENAAQFYREYGWVW